MAKSFNDVTTDVNSPPQYVKAKIGQLPEKNKKLILESYPDLKPLRVPFKDQNAVFSAMLVRQGQLSLNINVSKCRKTTVT